MLHSRDAENRMERWAPVIDLPDAVRAMAARGPEWATWVDAPAQAGAEPARRLEPIADGAPTHGYCSIVLPARTSDGAAAVLKIAFPDDESEHEHLALRRWGGDGAVRLLSAEPHRRALLLERLHERNLNELWDIEACEVVAALYRRIHVPALPRFARSRITSTVDQRADRATAQCAASAQAGRAGDRPRPRLRRRSGQHRHAHPR